MNCQNFENVITDIARNVLMNAEARAQAIAHAESCAACAARLADERALTSSLRAYALASTEETNAPRLEMQAKLLASFRAQHAAKLSAGETSRSPEESAKVVSLNEHVAATGARRAISGSRWVRQATPVAAAILLAVGVLIISRAWQTRQTEATDRADAAQLASQASPVASVETTAGELPAQPQAQGDAALIKPEQMALLQDASDTEADLNDAPSSSAAAFARAAAAQRRAARYRDASLTRNAAERPAKSLRGSQTSAAASEGEAEIATDFFSLTGESSYAQMDGGHVVRVELPRSALVSLGLPMNAERMSERVKADVLIGHDGVARAIRFVR